MFRALFISNKADENLGHIILNPCRAHMARIQLLPNSVRHNLQIEQAPLGDISGAGNITPREASVMIRAIEKTHSKPSTY